MNSRKSRKEKKAPESRPFTIGITATSACVPQFELELGVGRLRDAGFEVKIHPVVSKHHRFFAGTDEQRTAAFAEFACDPEIDAIWCARGGYGAARVIEGVEKLRGVRPGKVLLGYSDVTALLDFTREKWGWHSIHSPMPGTREFSLLPEEDFQSLIEVVSAFAEKKKSQIPGLSHRLNYIGKVRPKTTIIAPLVGGNMTVWDTLVGTRYQGKAAGRIVFFEDVTEAWYRIDRMLNHLRTTGALKGAKALVLGSWSDCSDSAMKVLAAPVPADLPIKEALRDPAKFELPLKPLRPTYESDHLLKEIFAEFSEKTGIPVAMGVPAGHGPRYAPLPLGRKWRLDRLGRLTLVDRKL